MPMTYGTDPLEADSDSDGIADGVEVSVYGTNPDEADNDDGIDDADEINVYGTEPTLADTDNDGIDDLDELDVYDTNPFDDDSDNDGVIDGDEVDAATDPLDGPFHGGTVDSRQTSRRGLGSSTISGKATG